MPQSIDEFLDSDDPPDMVGLIALTNKKAKSNSIPVKGDSNFYGDLFKKRKRQDFVRPGLAGEYVASDAEKIRLANLELSRQTNGYDYENVEFLNNLPAFSDPNDKIQTVATTLHRSPNIKLNNTTGKYFVQRGSVSETNSTDLNRWLDQ